VKPSSVSGLVVRRCSAARLTHFARTWVFAIAIVAGSATIAIAQETPRAAMTRLIEVMRDRDVPGLAALLPAAGTLAYSSTIEKPHRSDRLTPDTLRRDLEARSGFYEALFGFEGDDSWRDVFEETGFRPWTEHAPAIFRPSGNQYSNGRTFVRWRREGKRWVLAEIGVPDG
jgi:hypothetical protein